MRNHEHSRTRGGPWFLSILPILALTAAALATGGCASLFQGMDPRTRVDTRLDPLEAERRGEQVFAAYGIPVAERVANWRVESGRFIASEAWRMVRLEERIECGWDDDGLPRVRGRDVELEVTLRISGRSSSTNLRIQSSGRILTATDEEEGAKCQLAPAFARVVLEEVAGYPGIGSRFPVVARP
jgi:hypothetical protein